MVGDSLQVGSELRVTPEQVEQIVGADAGRADAPTGQVLPSRNARGAPGANPGLSLVTAGARLFRFFELRVDLCLPVHDQDYNREVIIGEIIPFPDGTID
jgi:hypothetical protein